jgi:hypothetical protein
MTALRPSLSVSHPMTGDSPYMPAMWALSTKPTMRSVSASECDAPMWSGVIDITATITRCPTEVEAMPSRAPGEATTACQAVRRPTCCAPCEFGSERPAKSSGSGRRKRKISTAPTTNEATAKANGALYLGRPGRIFSSGAGRLGPITAPTVVDQTTSESERPRIDGSARSTAAYRAASLPALAAPKTKNPANSKGWDRVIAANSTATAPAAPVA